MTEKEDLAANDLAAANVGPKDVVAETATEASPAGESKPAAAVPAADAKPAPAADAKPAPADAKPTDADAILPAKKYDENDLRAAVGASPIVAPLKRPTADHVDEDELELDDEPRSVKTIVAIVTAVAAGIAIVVLIFLGRANSDKLALQCEAERAVAVQGRAFPPWGFRALDGDAWQPIRITHDTRCQSRETDDVHALERWMLAMILDEVNALLAAHDPVRLDETEDLLKQSLLLTRPSTTPESETLAAERLTNHQEVERLLGDVTYWRAAGKLRDAAGVLSDAAKQFDSAAAQHPRHTTNAAAWSAYTRKLAEQLRVGPAAGAPGIGPAAPGTAPAAGIIGPTAGVIGPVAAGSASPSAPDTASADAAHAPAPPGSELPVEPGKPGASDAPATAPPPPLPASASTIPTGGVLL